MGDELPLSVALSLYQRGQVHFQKSELAEALECFESSIRADPTFPDAFNGKGCVLVAQGHVAEALSEFDEAIHRSPTYGKCFLNRSRAWLALGDREQASRDLSSAIAIVPKDTWVVHAIASLCVALSRCQEAINELTQLLDREDHDARTATLRQRALCWFELRDYSNAINDYTESLVAEPQDWDSLGRRGTAYYHMSEYEAAIDDFNAALAIQPTVALLLNWRGISFHQLREFEAAVADLTAAIELDPTCSTAYLNRALAYSCLDDPEQVMHDLNRAIELEPTGTEALYERAKLHLADDDFSSALDDLKEALRIEPSNTRVLKIRAKVWDEVGETELARLDYNRLNEISTTLESKEAATMQRRSKRIYDLVKQHFDTVAIDDLAIHERRFPVRVRADLQLAIDKQLLGIFKLHHFSGVRKQHVFDGVDFSELLVLEERDPPLAVPPQYEEIAIGGEESVQCLKDGIWLIEQDEQRLALFLEPASRHARAPGIRFQLATTNDERGAALSKQFFRQLETSVFESHCYRGKILSLEVPSSYTGESTGIRVHRLKSVDRTEVILPFKTLELLERNLIQFVMQRPRLRQLGMSSKKGLLFYGPPGTGKTHTIHYLAKELIGHTMLLISAEQVGLLDEYMSLARLLQPSIVVIEDVDLIARDRADMDSPCEEIMLNKLLNEMDGLKEDADIMFILTTNRPETLEAALASRPGRVDQAIEFPLPDDDGRLKLTKLYAHKLDLTDEVILEIVRRTAGVSAAFIKELMRRVVQFNLESNGDGVINRQNIDCALDEMLFAGGVLNLKLLGAKGDSTAGR